MQEANVARVEVLREHSDTESEASATGAANKLLKYGKVLVDGSSILGVVSDFEVMPDFLMSVKNKYVLPESSSMFPTVTRESCSDPC